MIEVTDSFDALRNRLHAALGFLDLIAALPAADLVATRASLSAHVQRVTADILGRSARADAPPDAGAPEKRDVEKRDVEVAAWLDDLGLIGTACGSSVRALYADVEEKMAARLFNLYAGGRVYKVSQLLQVLAAIGVEIDFEAETFPAGLYRQAILWLAEDMTGGER